MRAPPTPAWRYRSMKTLRVSKRDSRRGKSPWPAVGKTVLRGDDSAASVFSRCNITVGPRLGTATQAGQYAPRRLRMSHSAYWPQWRAVSSIMWMKGTPQGERHAITPRCVIQGRSIVSADPLLQNGPCVRWNVAVTGGTVGQKTTTDRSTSPRCIFANASSTWSSLISSETKASRSSRP